MNSKVQHIFLYLSKYLGLFALSKQFTKNGLRILCYHGFDMKENESDWHPGMFITVNTFKKRIDYIFKEKYRVLKLGKAIKLYKQKKLPNYSLVFTVDDGWYSTKSVAHKILKERSYYYTIYLTSYYCIKNTPVFNICMEYMFWKSKKSNVKLDNIGFGMTGEYKLGDKKQIKELVDRIIKTVNRESDEIDRCHLLQHLGDYLGVDYKRIERLRVFNLLSKDEIKELSSSGVDFQLHTHRHIWPKERHNAIKELSENTKIIKKYTGKTPRHFCYPSGKWSHEQIQYLEGHGIKSSTTTEIGINIPGITPNHIMCRIVDGEDKPQIKFEAEVSGFLLLLNELRRKLGKYCSWSFSCMSLCYSHNYSWLSSIEISGL